MEPAVRDITRSTRGIDAQSTKWRGGTVIPTGRIRIHFGSAAPQEPHHVLTPLQQHVRREVVSGAAWSHVASEHSLVANERSLKASAVLQQLASNIRPPLLLSQHPTWAAAKCRGLRPCLSFASSAAPISSSASTCVLDAIKAWQDAQGRGAQAEPWQLATQAGWVERSVAKPPQSFLTSGRYPRDAATSSSPLFFFCSRNCMW